MDLTTADPKGLVRESYRIEGITPGECRSIFVDWALSIPGSAPVGEAVQLLIATYGDAAPGHPMTAVLREALTAPAEPRRRGGRMGRQGLSG
jgi:hypothetical protein